MRRNLFMLGICAIAVAGLFAVACDRNEIDGEAECAPSMTISVEAIQAEQGGGAYAFSYEVEDSGYNGRIYCSSDADWITDIVADFGEVNFSVSANTGDARSTSLHVCYASSAGSVTEVVKIDQHGIVVPELPELIIGADGITVNAEGGTFSFDYTVVNPAADGTLTCQTDCKWIGDFDYSASGRVSFTVSANETEVSREGVISIEYRSAICNLTESFTVIQERGENEMITISDLVGTYLASGEALSSTTAHASPIEWTVVIREFSSTEVEIYNLTPIIAAEFPDAKEFAARASLNESGQLVIPFQYTGYILNGYYVGWLPCVTFEEGVGVFYNFNTTDCTLTYDWSAGSWTSDYGLICTGFKEPDNIYSVWLYWDFTCPGFTLTKISSDTSSVSVPHEGNHSVCDIELQPLVEFNDLWRERP